MGRFLVVIVSILLFVSLSWSKSSRYHQSWIDFNKNGKKDKYEDPLCSIEERVSDLLSQMTLDENTCQLATLYGSGRVLKDSLPTAEWKSEIWKVGIANIDEQANGLGTFGTSLSYPYSTSFSIVSIVWLKMLWMQPRSR